MTDPDQQDGSWTILTGHGHVLVEVARNPGARIRDISAAVGLTERSVQAIVADLEAAGYLTRTRVGRRTRYTVNPDSAFRHSAQDGHRIGPFLDLLAAAGAAGAAPIAAAGAEAGAAAGAEAGAASAAEAGAKAGTAAAAAAGAASAAEAGTTDGAETRDPGNRARWRPRKLRS
jgi:hypothetical protein